MRRSTSRPAVAAAAAVLGFLAVLAASQDPTPARSARRLELVDLIREQDERVAALRQEVGAIEGQLVATGTGGRAEEVRALLRQARRLEIRAGGAALRGPGVVVTLDDSSVSSAPTGDPNDLIVHERDIQTVVNALWAAGAEAISLNDERLTSTSAVRCAGNTLLLHGRVHSPPYRIAAIGDPDAIAASLTTQPGMDRLLGAVATFGLGFGVEPATVEIPARAATPNLSGAVPA